MARSFLLGALVGGMAVWLWQEEIREQVARRTQGARERAAGGLEVLEGVADRLLERAAAPVRTAERVLDRARGNITTNLRAGQELIRSGRSEG